jgi:hypothetical protein
LDVVKEVKFNKPTLDTDGLVFHVTTLSDAIPAGPQGVWIEDALVAKNPVLREREKNDIRFRFVAVNPLLGIAPTAPIQQLHRITSQSMPGAGAFGNYVALELYAEVTPADVTISLIDQARAGEADPGALTALAEQILRDGYELSCEFVNILRQKYGQYWLRPPEDLFHWTSVLYYSKPDQRWYHIGAGDDFAAKLLRRDWGSESEKMHRPLVLLKVIGEGDLEGLATAGTAPEPSFADEMVATALVELQQNRIRSAVVHAFIAYETAAKRGLEALLEGRLKGLESGAILEAITREVSTVTLGKVVLQHASSKPEDPPLDWGKIDAIYNTRNMIVHRGQRRMPPFEDIKAQILEVRSFVMRLQAALRNGSPSRAEPSAAANGDRDPGS